MRDAILSTALRRRQLVVAAELQATILDLENRIRTPVLPVTCPAPGRRATTPFVGEQDLRAIVIERGGMPVRKIRIGGRVHSNRVQRITDIDQESVSFARSCGQANRRVHRDVVTLPIW